MMESCEVLIVGGGPAGSTCAWRLRQAGIDVLLLDSVPFPRDKPCAGWITPAVLETLELDKDEYRQGRVLEEIRGFRTGMMQGGEMVTGYGETISYGIRRREFDQYLLQRSASRRWLGEPVNLLERKDGGWLVNGRFGARLVVGAGGHACPVARFLGARIGAEEVIVAQSAEFPLPGQEKVGAPGPSEMPELYFCRDLKGYGWIFRKGEFLNVGFGRRDRVAFGREMSEFRAFLRMRGIEPPDNVGYRGHAYRAYRRLGGRTLVGDALLLVGDSAGVAHPESGEGILPAIESAILASRTILAANGDYRRDNLEPYGAGLSLRHGRGSPEISRVIPYCLGAFLGAKLLSSRLFVRHILLNRWFLHSTEKLLSPH